MPREWPSPTCCRRGWTLSCSASCTYTPNSRTVWWGLALVPSQSTTLDLVVQYIGTPSAVTNIAYLIWGSTIWQTASFRFGPMNRVYLPIVSHNR